MAAGKNSFVLYCDMKHTIDLLDDNLAGKLFKHLLQYVNDENPQTDDLLLRVAFEPIKRQLKRDLKDWESEKETRKDSGQLGNLSRWHPDLYAKVIEKQLTIEEAIKIVKSLKSHSDKNIPPPSDPIPRIANVAVNATATDNVTVNDNGISKAAAAAIGAGKVKEIANNVWKDQSWKEQLSMGLSITIPELKKWMAQFNASVADDTIHDFNDARYKRMIRGWISKQQAKGVTVESGVTKKSDAPTLKRLPT